MGQDKKAASVQHPPRFARCFRDEVCNTDSGCDQITLQVNQRKAASANARSSIIASRGASHIKHGNQT
eukprot:1818904-Rhodomonas_salina.1